MAQLQTRNTHSTTEDPNPAETSETVYTAVRWAKGELIGSGVSGIVERLPSGYIVKSPWPGWQEDECREDIAQEARAYQRLFDYFGAHKRFVQLISYSETDYTITMEYMANGTLRSYVEAHYNRISREQRHRWIQAMAEGMEMLHSAKIIHCDFSPRNMLLDRTLELKVADLGCVSMDGSKSSAGGSVRFYPPRCHERIQVDDDLFALGSSIFEVLTGKPPYIDLETRAIQNLYDLRQFPDLVGLDLSDVIRDCWLLQARSAREVYQRINRLHGDSTKESRASKIL